MNAAAPLTLNGDLFQAYASYKKATNYVIKWLTGSCAPGVARPFLSSVREMRHLANQIISSRIQIPDDLITIFHKAVQARKQLASFYQRSSNKSDHEATETHAYFNETFAEIYKDLAYAHRRTSRELSQLTAVPHADISSVPVNIFECLKLNDDAAEESQESLGEPDRETTLQSSVHVSSDTIEDFNRPAIQGDILEELASVHTYLMVRS